MRMLVTDDAVKMRMKNGTYRIPVGTAGLQPRAPDPSGHCRTSSASSRSQWALPDFIRELQIPVGTAGLQPRVPDPSGHCRTSTASSRFEWALPDFNRELQIPVSTAGLQPATSPLDVIRQLEDRDIPPTGRISHPVPLTLSDEEPWIGQGYWLPAAKWTDQALAYFSISTPSAAFFVYGGYVYFDRMGRVKGVFAVSLGNGLSFEPGQPWDQRYTAALENRWVHITVPYLLDKGRESEKGGVLQPAAKDVLGGEDWKAPPHGCFVYKFSESPQLADDRDVFFAVAGSGEDSKAFGRMGAEEQALQSLRRQLGGDHQVTYLPIQPDTLQSANLRKVQQCLQDWDANRDGKISENEMAAALKTLNPKISPETQPKLSGRDAK
eukprot:s910_g30.t1